MIDICFRRSDSFESEGSGGERSSRAPPRDASQLTATYTWVAQILIPALAPVVVHEIAHRRRGDAHRLETQRTSHARPSLFSRICETIERSNLRLLPPRSARAIEAGAMNGSTTLRLGFYLRFKSRDGRVVKQNESFANERLALKEKENMNKELARVQTIIFMNIDAADFGHFGE